MAFISSSERSGEFANCSLELHHYKVAQEKHKIAMAEDDVRAAEAAQNELNALVLFKHDMAAYQRMYAFLSQIFDYGNTAIEKRFIFYKRLLPLLAFGREREGIDLSKVILTHHALKHQGNRTLSLDTLDAASEGLQFFGQYYRIHRSRLSFSILSRSGTKSAVFSRCRVSSCA